MARGFARMNTDRQVEKSRAVREMFGAIAPRYDFLNHFLSGNIDRRWRHHCLREVGRRLPCGTPTILDVGCGTGDLSLNFAGLGPVVGCDFSRPMLEIAREKARGAPGSVSLLEADALSLPFGDECFDAVVSAFVLRNLADIPRGLGEMRRVLKRGGVLGVLEFALPGNRLLGGLYRFYFTRVLPRIGALVSGSGSAYRYLPSSVQSFPPPEELEEAARQAGFARVEHRRYTGGIAFLLLAGTDG